MKKYILLIMLIFSIFNSYSQVDTSYKEPRMLVVSDQVIQTKHRGIFIYIPVDKNLLLGVSIRDLDNFTVNKLKTYDYVNFLIKINDIEYNFDKNSFDDNGIITIQGILNRKNNVIQAVGLHVKHQGHEVFWGILIKHEIF